MTSPWQNMARPAGIALIALSVHLAFVAALPERWRRNQSTDYVDFYEPAARNVIAGKGYVLRDGTPALDYPPGFALLLAGVFQAASFTGISEDLALRTENAIEAVLVALLTYLIATRVFGSSVGLAASVLVATYPFQLWLTKQPGTIHSFAILLLLSVYLLIPKAAGQCPGAGRGFLAGVLIGLASLIRPFGIGLSVVFVVAPFFFKPRAGIRKLALFSSLLLLGNIAALLPWEIWAKRASGRWIPLSTNGPGSSVDGLTFSAVRSIESRRPLRVPQDVEELVRDIVDHRKELRSTGAIAMFMIRSAVARPVAVLKLVAIKAARSWYGSDSQQFEIWIAIIQLPYLLLCAGGIAMAFKWGPMPREFAIVVGLLVAYSWFMTTAVLSILRYMVPAMLLLLIFGGLCVTALLAKRASGGNRGGGSGTIGSGRGGGIVGTTGF